MKNEPKIDTVKKRFNIIGHSDKLHQALQTAIRVASTDLTILLSGPSGVGKEIFSNVIYSLSNRKHNKFIAINCGAIPPGTINSELFGHEKGAYTGATSDRKGYFETVNGGTIFLDEIGEMPLDTQAYLLRVLESGEFMRVGSSKVQKTDVRIIAATNKNLEERVYHSKFREDLYYRLNTISIEIPALRDRKEDIHILFRKFAMDFAEKYRTESIHLTHNARQLLEHYSWPGNIRELKNLTEQLSILSDSSLIDENELIAFYPKINNRQLPAKIDNNNSNTGLHEREILYKLLFDMKSDLNELKAIIFGLIRNNKLVIDDIHHLDQLNINTQEAPTFENAKNTPSYPVVPHQTHYEAPRSSQKPFIIHSQEPSVAQHIEVEEENLSIEDMERDLIKKALERYRGRRKEAAVELGISERTLYRKIKQYAL